MGIACWPSAEVPWRRQATPHPGPESAGKAMDWFIGFLGAIIGTPAGGLSVFLTTRAQMRRELQHTYDQELRTRRVESYMSLYKRTDKLPRYWPGRQPIRSDMQAWV